MRELILGGAVVALVVGGGSYAWVANRALSQAGQATTDIRETPKPGEAQPFAASQDVVPRVRWGDLIIIRPPPEEPEIVTGSVTPAGKAAKAQKQKQQQQQPKKPKAAHKPPPAVETAAAPFVPAFAVVD